VADYTRKTQKTPEDIVAMMDAETWMTAEEALAHGFIDQITPVQRAANQSGQPSNSAPQWNLSVYPKAPQVQQNLTPVALPELLQLDDEVEDNQDHPDKPEPQDQPSQAQAHANRTRLLELL